jgi:hypothetical protein
MASLGCVQEGQYLPVLMGPILMVGGVQVCGPDMAPSAPQPGEMVWEFPPPPDYGGERAKQICAERGWNVERLDATQEVRLRRIIDNEQPAPKRVPRRAPPASERYAATAMAEAMSAAHAGGEYPDLPAGVGYSRFDHPGWS